VGANSALSCTPKVKDTAKAEIGDPVREIEIVPREDPVPEELPREEPAVPERELEPV
jgi:hypothetical protein